VLAALGLKSRVSFVIQRARAARGPQTASVGNFG
jgi:hypothetical protein